jgi:hypothetical protein
MGVLSPLSERMVAEMPIPYRAVRIPRGVLRYLDGFGEGGGEIPFIYSIAIVCDKTGCLTYVCLKDLERVSPPICLSSREPTPALSNIIQCPPRVKLGTQP